MSVTKCSALIATVLLSTSVSAKQYWSDNSFTALKGSHYEVGDTDKSVLTIEHASGHNWGSIFAFVDRLHHHNDDNHELYGEVGVSYNLYNAKDGFIKSAYVTPQWEFGSDAYTQFDNFLAGVGVDLAVPGATFFNVNLYRRNNDNGANNNQLTVVWSFPFANGVVYDGFMDMVSSIDSESFSSGYNFTSQLKYDLGQHIGVEKSKLFVGVEYVYWKNKFGISGVTESNANLLIKWHL